MDLHRIFFDNWMGVVRTLIIGVLAYAALVLLLRSRESGPCRR
ncbi:MAG: hypothetical protein MPW16_03995 [Candidatus Manganitrophus sp.]|nr:MAG: hypothetical protein MPW16_03995 [Candidatus Manganitrophus sp.]